MPQTGGMWLEWRSLVLFLEQDSNLCLPLCGQHGVWEWFTSPSARRMPTVQVRWWEEVSGCDGVVVTGSMSKGGLCSAVGLAAWCSSTLRYTLGRSRFTSWRENRIAQSSHSNPLQQADKTRSCYDSIFLRVTTHSLLSLSELLADCVQQLLHFSDSLIQSCSRFLVSVDLFL